MGTGNAAVFAPLAPALSPRMLLPTFRAPALPFPFDQPNVEYFYYCRAAVYALAHLWELSGQEVLFPAYCCGQELRALEEAGVKVRYYPVHGRMEVDPAEVAAMVTPATKAVYLIHYFGFPGPVEEIAALCQERKLRLIEDCALALFSRKGDVPLGSWGDAAVFSLHKSLPIPAGGALVLNHERGAKLPQRRPPSLRSTGSLTVSALRRYFDAHGFGWGNSIVEWLLALARPLKRATGERCVEVMTDEWDPEALELKMSGVSRVILSHQRASLIVERHRRNYLYLRQQLGELSRPVHDELPPGVCPLFYPMRFPDNYAARKAMEADGLQASSWWADWPPGADPAAFPEVEELRRTVVALPCHEGLNARAMERMVNVVRRTFERSGAKA